MRAETSTAKGERPVEWPNTQGSNTCPISGSLTANSASTTLKFTDVSTTGTGIGELALELLDALLEVGVLFDQPCEFGFDEVEELIDLVLVVAALTDRRFAERDVVHISWCQPHVGSPHCR